LLSGIQHEVRQICEVNAKELIIFGWSGAYNINILSEDDGREIESFFAYDPVISPDQHWMIFRRFYSFHSEFVVSEEYCLYNLQTGKEEGQRGRDGVGKRVYPRLPEDVTFLDVPDIQTHSFRSSFFWSDDSQMVTFVDRSLGETRVVVISLKDQSKPEALAADLSLMKMAEQSTLPKICSSSDFGNGLLQQVSDRIGSVSFDLVSEDSECNGRTVVIPGIQFVRVAIDPVKPVLRKRPSKGKILVR
jgi:hypothetical protein